MIKINVITKNLSWLRIIKNPIKYIERKVKKLNKKNKKFRKNIIFCTLLLSNEKEIKNLNKKFRKKNKVTDVLSFPFHIKKNLVKLLKKDKEIYLGDIIINFKKINYSGSLKNFEFEFDKLWVHGLIHLFGYDHKTKKNFNKMRILEKSFLNYIK